ncbi:hypothetical protein K402DRAFT_33344 [Aulographum hederae CBS 113979]|uniref:Uncharacterized protein n=1 Tax=Aulographum hederae CBS 113979 TaxID=1176131 RepID=A0A6G1H5K8_9PEZI|nr:hypothetical protein K402DRAFT_33344 [Aulographum hederae CBS 113979]
MESCAAHSHCTYCRTRYSNQSQRCQRTTSPSSSVGQVKPGYSEHRNWTPADTCCSITTTLDPERSINFSH